jgi:hypothetical protein
LEVFEEHGGRHAESARDPEDVEKANVPFAALDSAEIRPVDTGTVREILLRHTLARALCAHAGSEAFKVLVAHRGHLSRDDVYRSTAYEYHHR